MPSVASIAPPTVPFARLTVAPLTVDVTAVLLIATAPSASTLPVTSASLIFPACLLLIHFFDSLSFIYYILLVLVAVLFIVKFRLKKPGFKEIMMMVGFGLIEFLIILAVLWMKSR